MMRSGITMTQPDAMTKSSRMASMSPLRPSSEPNHENGLSAATNPLSALRIAVKATTRYVEMTAASHSNRKKRRLSPYSVPSGHVRRTTMSPPKTAEMAR